MDSLSAEGADDDWHWHWVRATPWEPQALSQKNFPPIVAAALVRAESPIYASDFKAKDVVRLNRLKPCSMVSSVHCRRLSSPNLISVPLVPLLGIYVLLFALTIVLLLSNRMRLHNLMLAGLVAMLGLSTADIALTWRVLLREPQSIVRGTTVTFLQRVFPKFMIYVSSNMVAAGLLVS